MPKTSSCRQGDIAADSLSPKQQGSAPPAPPAIRETVERSHRKLVEEPGAITHPLANGRYQSPLRYPGAKSSFAPVIDQMLSNASGHRAIGPIDLLVEPFAGGASVSLRLVSNGTVARILLADADPLVAAFWQEAASRPQHLIDRMTDEHLRFVSKGGATAVARWDYWRLWTAEVGQSDASVRSDLAMKCLFLNRTTFSGILHGQAGPIGGRAQTSQYPIGCRYMPEVLADRIDLIGNLYSGGRLVDVWCCDWESTLAAIPERYPHLIPSKVMAYLDPPYLAKSEKLYRQSFDPNGGYSSDAERPSVFTESALLDSFAHHHLAEYLTRKAQFRWILSYDHHPELMATLYPMDRMYPSVEDRVMLGVRTWRISKRLVTLRYTAAARRRGTAEELLLTTLPASVVPTDGTLRQAS